MSYQRTQVATDDFNRADSEGLGANWADITTVAGNGQCRIRTNKLTGGAASGACARWNGAGTITDDQYASLVLSGVGSQGGGLRMGVAVRIGGGLDAARTLYLFWMWCDGFGTYTTQLCRFAGNTATVLGVGTFAWVDGDRIEIEAFGSTINGLKNGVVLLTATDTTYPTGRFGVAPDSYMSAPFGDDFIGGNLTAITFPSISFTPAASFSVAGEVNPTVLGGVNFAFPAPVFAVVTAVGPQIVSTSISLIPAVAFAVARNSSTLKLGGSAAFSWDPSPDPATTGYKVHYGPSSGVYTGTDAIEGPSPINVGNVLTYTLHGLLGTYYVAVTAYDPTRESVYSNEIVFNIASGLLTAPATLQAFTDKANPVIGLSSLNLTPAPAFVFGVNIQSPLIIAGNTSINTFPSFALGSSTNPTVVLSNQVIVPAVIFAVAGRVNPTALQQGGTLFAPAVLYTVSGNVDPFIIHGNITIAPVNANCVVRKTDPGVVFSTIPVFAPANSNCVVTTFGPATVTFSQVVVAPAPSFAVVGYQNPNSLGGVPAAPLTTKENRIGWFKFLRRST